jgi:hypothetical protein
MRRLERMNDTLFGIENSTIDPNKFYSILLDARAASMSENMCDIAEKLLQGEKENAKSALDQLLKMKKNLFSGTNTTIDLLITFYQEKMGVLKDREEHLKKMSLDSRSLLEDKRKKDEEFATVKQQAADCKKELDELTVKFEQLKIREQELTLIEHQLREELNRNENEIVNGLYEIILPQTDIVQEPVVEEITVAAVNNEASVVEALENKPAAAPQSDTKTITAVFEPPVLVSAKKIMDSEGEKDLKPDGENEEPSEDDITTFPKSVVKTNSGKIIGEYYYNNKVYKNERHYIFNSQFFAEELLKYARMLIKKFEMNDYNDLMQMVQDTYKRVNENKQLHFEVATNEILNEKTLKRLWQDSKLRSIDEIERFGVRLKAKIDALGNNYVSMLKEQMQRCVEKT